jgi:hypothetical protein
MAWVGGYRHGVLNQPIDEAVLKRFERGMESVVSRKDQAEKAAALVAALPSCAEQESFTLAALRRGVTTLRPASARQLRQFIDGGGWKVDRLRLELVACALDAGVDAVLLETCEVVLDEAEILDVVSIHLLSGDYSIPVGWRRMGFLDVAPGTGLDVGQGEFEAASFLLRQFRQDCLQLGHSPLDVPVFSLDYRYGESEALRKSLSKVGVEHILEVGPEYVGFAQSDWHPDASWTKRLLADQIPFTPGAPPPPPQLLDASAQPGDREFVVPFRRQGAETYAICRPEVKVSPGGLTGRRAHQRASRLGEELGQIQAPDAASDLLLANFRHRKEMGWEATAFVASALRAAHQGLFPRGAR